MRLHENKSLFRDSIRFTAQQMNLKLEYVEKDYWVTYVLFTLFKHDVGKQLVFKGGTALSKCYQIIERFSEDIDLLLLRTPDETDSRLKSRLKEVSTLVHAVLPEIPIAGITRKLGMNRKTAHVYNKEFTADYGQARDVIILESSWLGYHEPCTTKSITSFVAKMILNNNRNDIADKYDLLPFNVTALEPTRTICEKIMSLVRFSYDSNPIQALKNKIRHIYDLHQLLTREVYFAYFHSVEFEEMLLRVARDDIKSFRNNNAWLIHHPGEALIFRDLDNVWLQLKTAYNNDFKDLVYGELPEQREVFETLRLIQQRLKTISWGIDGDRNWV
jgi:hypothetical protein